MEDRNWRYIVNELFAYLDRFNLNQKNLIMDEISMITSDVSRWYVYMDYYTTLYNISALIKMRNINILQSMYNVEFKGDINELTDEDIDDIIVDVIHEYPKPEMYENEMFNQETLRDIIFDLIHLN